MKISVLTCIILLTAVIGFGQKPKDEAPPKFANADAVPRISLDDAKIAFDGSDALFVDERPAVTYKENHIKGAINIPYGSTQTFDSLPKGKKIVVYCS